MISPYNRFMALDQMLPELLAIPPAAFPGLKYDPSHRPPFIRNMRTEIEYAFPIAIAKINQMRLHLRRRRERLISQFQRYQHIHTF